MKNALMFVAVMMIFGCGAPAPEPSSSEDAASGIANTGVNRNGASAESDVAFADMSFGERKDFMVDVVTPQMKPLFIEHHPDFSCASCHGDNMADVNFEMPNTLDPLNPAAMPFTSEDENIRAAAMWMQDTIVPKMAGLLKEAPFNPDTKEGFGCFDCHATKTE